MDTVPSIETMSGAGSETRASCAARHWSMRADADRRSCTTSATDARPTITSAAEPAAGAHDLRSSSRGWMAAAMPTKPKAIASTPPRCSQPPGNRNPGTKSDGNAG
jgi:hypothetical protein